MIGLSAFCGAYWPILAEIAHRWWEPLSYYSHALWAFLVLLATFLYCERHVFKGEFRSSPIIGSVLLLFALGLMKFSLDRQIYFGQALAVIVGCSGSVVYFFGSKGLLAVRGYLIYLYSLVPIPSYLLTQVVFWMSQLTATLSGALLSLIHSKKAVHLHENLIVIHGHSILVGESCSGLRMLLAMFAIGGILVLLEKRRRNQLILLASLVPAAILANILRVVLVCELVAHGHTEFGQGSAHEGLGVFAFALAMLWVSRFFKGGRVPKVRPTGERNFRSLGLYSGRSALSWCWVVFLLGQSAILVHGEGEGNAIATSTPIRTLIPADFAGWRSREVSVPESTYQILGTRDLMMRSYEKSPALPAVYFYVVHSNESRKVAHPVEICMRSEGFETEAMREFELKVGAGVESSSIIVNRAIFTRGDSRILVYSWYRIHGIDTPSYFKHQWLAVFAGNSDVSDERASSMLRLSVAIDGTGSDSENERKAELALEVFSREALPGILKVIP